MRLGVSFVRSQVLIHEVRRGNNVVVGEKHQFAPGFPYANISGGSLPAIGLPVIANRNR